METAVAAEPKRGNPNFGKKPTQTSKYDPKKRFHFQLMSEYSSAKPRDYDTGELMDNPYPPIQFITNSGVGTHPETGDIENWRYVFGYPSIWVKDQDKPEPSEAQLANPKNFIEFRNGSLFVVGVNSALLDAMMIQDEFEEVKNPINVKPPLYRLVNPEKERKIADEAGDMAYEAEKTARELPLAEMLPVAMHYGIDVDNPEENAIRIRSEFIHRAKSDPSGFSKQVLNPKAKYKFVITNALRKNIISSNVVPGKMVLVDTGKVYFDLKEGDVTEQFAQLVVQRNDQAVKLYEHIENVLAAV